MQKSEEQSQSSLDMLSIGAASEYLNVSIDTIRRWEKKGRIEALRSPGGHRYFKKTELDKVFGTKYARVGRTKAYRKKPKIKVEAVEVSTIETVDVVQEQKQDTKSPRFVTEEVREIQIPPNVPVAIRTRGNNTSASVFQSSSNILIPRIQTQAQMSSQLQTSTASTLPRSNTAERPQSVNSQTVSQTGSKEDNTQMIIIILITLSVLLLAGIIIYFYNRSQILSPVP